MTILTSEIKTGIVMMPPEGVTLKAWNHGLVVVYPGGFMAVWNFFSGSGFVDCQTLGMKHPLDGQICEPEQRLAFLRDLKSKPVGPPPGSLACTTWQETYLRLFEIYVKPLLDATVDE